MMHKFPVAETVQNQEQDQEPMDIQSDWTDFFDRLSIIRLANRLIDDLVTEIHARRQPIHEDLDSRELSLLCRFPIHVGVNIFIERLLRVAYFRQMKWERIYPEVSYKPRYFKDTDKAVTSYYFDSAINADLLHRICKILGGPVTQENTSVQDMPEQQEGPRSIFQGTRATIKGVMESYVKLSRPEVVGEYSNWMREVLPLRRMLSFHYPDRDYPVDNAARSSIRDCCRIVFLNHVDGILNKLKADQKEKLSVLFADFIDHIIPLSIVEGLPERFSYFGEMIKKWNVKQVHSFIGYYYNENYKVFAILARRKGALLIGHAHGASNLCSFEKQCRNDLGNVDIYFTWGIEDSSWMKDESSCERTRIFSPGSAYLGAIKPWKKAIINQENMTLLYASGPISDVMWDLQEITPEANLRHRMRVLCFLKEICRLYPGLKILYKPFPMKWDNDPIQNILSEEFLSGRIKHVNEKPSKLFQDVDVVLWDAISTGFFESLASHVPTLIFQSMYEYERAKLKGKELDDGLKACGVLFREPESGIRSFERIIRDHKAFASSSAKQIDAYQRALGYPISRKEYRKRIEEAMTSLGY